MKYLIAISILTALSSRAKAQSLKKIDNKIITKAAKDVGVPPVLLKSICYAESALKEDAYVHQDGNNVNHAFGICQVLYNTAKGLGLKEDKGCEADFRTEAQLKKAGSLRPVLERTTKNCILFDPYKNAYYAAKYLKSKLKQYDNSWISAIAAYNSGSLRTCKTGKVHNSKGKFLYSCKKGGLLNQKYVDRVWDVLILISEQQEKGV